MKKRKINNYMTVISNNSESELYIYGYIVGKTKNDDDVSPAVIRNLLSEIGQVKILNLHINSGGGSVFDGNTIIDILDDYRTKNGTQINVYIEGLAASMASGIAMVADKIYMSDNSMFMLHKPATEFLGNLDTIQSKIIMLQKAEDILVQNYMRHFNGTEDEVRALMKAESWLTAEEAYQYGFCDEIIAPMEVAASVRGILSNMQKYTTIPDSIVARFFGEPFATVKPIDTETKKGSNKTVFEYDTKLEDYGINEELFNSYEISAETITNIINAVSEKQADRFQSDILDKIHNALGENVKDLETVLNLAQKALNLDENLDIKAKAYDKLVSNAIDEAVKSGIRAKGEDFNENKWRKLLASLDYDEILDQSQEWNNESKIALNAGKRISKPYQTKRSDSNINLNALKNL